MNPAELRSQIYRPLAGLNRPAEIVSAELVSPVPGEPLAIDIVTTDPYSQPPGAERRYRVTIEEV